MSVKIKITNRKDNIVTALAEGDGDKFRIKVDVEKQEIVEVTALDGCSANQYEDVANRIFDIVKILCQ